MKLRQLLILFCTLLLIATADADGPPPAPPATAPAAPAPAQPAAPAPATTLEPAPAKVPLLPPTAPVQPPETPNPVGMVVLAIVLAHVAVPLFLVGYLLLGWLLLKLFRTSLTSLAMGIMQQGGLPTFKKIGIALGILIVLPSGFLGLHWAARLLSHPMEGGAEWVFGFGISIVTGIVFLSLVKAVARQAKKQLAAKMGGGGFPGLGGMGGFPGMGGMGGGRGEKQAKPGKRGPRPPDKKRLR